MATESHDGAEKGMELVFHPMDQFIVKPLFGDGAVGMFTVTNVTLWMALSVLCVIALLVLGTSGQFGRTNTHPVDCRALLRLHS